MLTPYITAAMRHAHYELLPEGEGYYGEIPALEGVYATASTLEACREELQSVLEGWVMLGLAMGHPFPEVDGRELIVRRDAA
jgi:predicted RNase H-like HicB family nuclease